MELDRQAFNIDFNLRNELLFVAGFVRGSALPLLIRQLAVSC